MSVRTSTTVWTYVAVFAALLALWGLNFGLSFIHYGRYFSNAIAIAIGLTQVLLVVLFFMHVKYYRDRLVWFFAGAGLFWLGILMVLTMSDYLTRTRPPGVNAKGEPVFLQSQP
jgi:cytochrome c oxidase subunit 4